MAAAVAFVQFLQALLNDRVDEIDEDLLSQFLEGIPDLERALDGARHDLFNVSPTEREDPLERAAPFDEGLRVRELRLSCSISRHDFGRGVLDRRELEIALLECVELRPGRIEARPDERGLGPILP